MGTTLDKKEEVKKSVRTKKVVAVLRESKTVTEKKSQKPKAKATPKTAEKRVVQKTKKQVVSKKAEGADAPEVVFVPSTASLRLLEKVELYTIWYERHVPVMMSSVAKVGGYAFIFFGAIFAVFSYIDTKSLTATPAALVCSEDVCSEVLDADLPDTAPKISFLNSIPDILLSDTDFKLSATNAPSITVTLTSIETGSVLEIEPEERQSETEYRFLLPAARLAPATYRLSATTKQAGSTYTFEGPVFTIPQAELPVATELKTTSAIEEVVTSDAEPSEQEALPEEILAADIASTTEVEEVEVIDGEDPISSDEEQAVESDATLTTSISSTLSPLTISLREQADAAYVAINTGQFSPTRVDVYSQVLAVGQPLFLGQATLTQGEWIFSVSALNLPSAPHYLYAAFTVAGKVYQSDAVTYSPHRDNLARSSTEADLAILVQKIELALLASSVNNENRRRYFDYFAASPEALFAQSEELQFADRALIDTIDTAMRADIESLQPLLLRYAAAVQSESTFMTALSSAALTSHYTRLASTIATETGEPTTVPAIHTLLALRYQVLKDKIRESEEQIKQDTNNLTARDGDQDGLSDFDEVANFGTDPLRADTDGDGVMDGIELARQGDPLSSDLTGTPSLSSSIEDVSFDTVVEINLVGPEVIASKDNTKSDEYFVRVEGRSVPNSHVYILSQTTKSVGVVKTSSSGTFTYTIEQDFAVGEHEIVVVHADTAGNIVASSKPYRFARTNNAFVAAAALGAGEITTTESTEDNVLLNVLVAAVGVIAFGLILLLLGNTLRNRRTQKSQVA